jgi:predicted RNA methylase
MRADLGQVLTPAPLADLVLALALDGMPASARVLDPACGDGVFLARAAARGVRAAGVEIDPALAAAAAAHGDVRCGDFFAVAPAEHDAVVGNPPYVRQERLGDGKRRLAALTGAPPRADLALAFVLRSLRFVRPGGRVAFVLSAAVLDADYAAVLAGAGRVTHVIVSPRERWFPDAAVHAIILVIERGPPGPTWCARLRVPVAEAAARVRRQADLGAVADVRVAAIGESWAPLLRAPDVWLDLARRAPLVPLAELCDIRRGATSGANGFFYVPRGAPIEPRFLRPLLKTPKDAAGVRISAGALPLRAFVCPLDARALRAFPGARAHVQAHLRLAVRPTLRVRPRWWSLEVRPARLFLTKAYFTRFVQHLASTPVVADQRFYAVVPRRGVSLELLAAVLNGSLTALALESLGRASMGEGALEWSVGDAARLPVIDPRGVPAAAASRAFADLCARPVGDVFAASHSPARAKLDAALLGPFAELGQAVRDGLTAAVTDRLARSGIRLH